MIRPGRPPQRSSRKRRTFGRRQATHPANTAEEGFHSASWTFLRLAPLPGKRLFPKGRLTRENHCDATTRHRGRPPPPLQEKRKSGCPRPAPEQGATSSRPTGKSSNARPWQHRQKPPSPQQGKIPLRPRREQRRPVLHTGKTMKRHRAIPSRSPQAEQRPPPFPRPCLVPAASLVKEPMKADVPGGG